MKKILFIVMAVFSFHSIFAKQSPFTLTFSSGGGFTGIVTTYTLNSDGSFYKADNASTKGEPLSKVKNKDIKEVRKLLANVNFAILNINKSGNITYYITLQQDGKEHKTQWTGATSGDPALDALYQKLSSLIPHK